MVALKELKLSFGRLRDDDIKRQAKNYKFAAGSCSSVEKLQIYYHVVGKMASLANESWMSFFAMFAGVKTLSLTAAAGTEAPEFWPRVLSSMPALKVLDLAQCSIGAQHLQALSTPMTDPNC